MRITSAIKTLNKNQRLSTHLSSVGIFLTQFTMVALTGLMVSARAQMTQSEFEGLVSAATGFWSIYQASVVLVFVCAVVNAACKRFKPAIKCFLVALIMFFLRGNVVVLLNLILEKSKSSPNLALFSALVLVLMNTACLLATWQLPLIIAFTRKSQHKLAIFMTVIVATGIVAFFAFSPTKNGVGWPGLVLWLVALLYAFGAKKQTEPTQFKFPSFKRPQSEPKQKTTKSQARKTAGSSAANANALTVDSLLAVAANARAARATERAHAQVAQPINQLMSELASLIVLVAEENYLHPAAHLIPNIDAPGDSKRDDELGSIPGFEELGKVPDFESAESMTEEASSNEASLNEGNQSEVD